MGGLSETTVELDKLLLDPNNYRFHDRPDYVAAEENRFHEAGVQQRTARRLRDDSLLALKNSILTNGFLTFERIVVRPYDAESGRYLVIEGNRRTAALKWIKDDHEAGVPVDQPLLSAMQAVPVISLSGEDNTATRLSLMGVRHVGGINEWGGYQRAKLVTELRDDYGFDTSEVANRLGMKAQEVNRRYRAFRALRQMEDDEEFGDLAEASMYPLFHEAVSVPVVRKWLDWDDASGEFQDNVSREHFYELITATDQEEGDPADPKITSYSQVRQLRAVLDVPEAKRALLDPDRSFHDAVGLAKAEELSRSWATEIAEAVAALNSVSAVELEKLKPEDVKEIEKLRDLAVRLLRTYEKVKP